MQTQSGGCITAAGWAVNKSKGDTLPAYKGVRIRRLGTYVGDGRLCPRINVAVASSARQRLGIPRPKRDKLSQATQLLPDGPSSIL